MASSMRNTYTAVLARGELWQDEVATEPYEAAWAGEAVFFVRVTEVHGGAPLQAEGRVQISPDGMHWVDEGASLMIDARVDHLGFARCSHFGGWLRLRTSLPAGMAVKVVATLALKA